MLNNSRVIHARLFAEPGTIEVLLIRETSPLHWVAIGKPGKKLQIGSIFTIRNQDHFARFEVLKSLPDGTRILRFYENPELDGLGQLPLPPYILKSRKAHGEVDYQPADEKDYQTVYAEKPGSVAAPTAGLHFTPELLSRFPTATLTLNIGLGTFRPVKSKNVEDHDMHEESYEIPEGLKEQCDAAARVVAVGTTVCRVLEARPGLEPGPGSTSIFIRPPYQFKRTDALITNFHLPESTLLMLVCALGGYEFIMAAYREAVKNHYRFYSYGDAMLIL